MSGPWYSSWFPSIPSVNFALPSRLQGRFISFVLKKTLGNFLKPGQLDAHQIDSQIGSGYVQINDLELDDQVCQTVIMVYSAGLTLASGYQQIIVGLADPIT